MSIKFISPKKSVNSATFEFPAVKNLLLSFDIEKLEQTGAKHVVNDEEIKGLPLLAIFNSNLVKLWIEYNCPVLNGGARNISKTYFENFRIPLDNAELLQQLASLADEIIAAKKAGEDTTKLENQINTLVYQLYGITDTEEIEVVEKR